MSRKTRRVTGAREVIRSFARDHQSVLSAARGWAASSAGSRAGSPRAMPHSVPMPSTRTWRGAAAGRALSASGALWGMRAGTRGVLAPLCAAPWGAGVAAPRGEPRLVALGVVVVDEAEIERGAGAQLQLLERCEIGVVGAALRHRQVEEIDGSLHPRHDAVDDLDHDAGVLRLHHVLVGRAAVAQVIAELDLARHRVADLAEHVDGLFAEIDWARLVIAF